MESYYRITYNGVTHQITGSFFDFISASAKLLQVKLSHIESYKTWDDSDQPGIDERAVVVAMDGRRFQASMTHNRWQDFKEIVKE